MTEPLPTQAGETVYLAGEPLYGGAFTLCAIEEASPGTQAEPFVLPGEQVAFLDKAGLKRMRIVSASPSRVAPGCVHFGVCGGCQYQHASYPEQLAVKQTILNGLFDRAGLTDRPALEVHAAEPWRYRNRIRMRLAALPDGSLASGYRERGTNRLLPVRMCPIAAPLLWRAVEAVREEFSSNARSARWLTQVSELELFADATDEALQATFFVRDASVARAEPSLFAEVSARVKDKLPQLMGVGAMPDPELSRRARRAWSGQVWGAPGLMYRVAGREHWVSRGSFFQVNRWLVERLVELVTAGLPEAGAHGLAWDLFAGVGLLTLPLAERFGRVVAVEGADTAARDLAQGLARAARESRRSAGALEAVHASTLDFLRGRQFDRERPELAVLDPPRAGLGSEGAALLAKMAPRRIVYVACDPTSLVRDLAVLLAARYRIASLQLIDLFPQTVHLETIVHLELGS